MTIKKTVSTGVLLTETLVFMNSAYSDLQTVALQQAGLSFVVGLWRAVTGVGGKQHREGGALETGRAGEVSVRLAGQQD